MFFEQIDEAKRLLDAGSILNLRLAMILLDNVAEVLMNRELRYRFSWDDLLKASGATNGYSAAERWKAERFFDEKVRLLLRMGTLSKDQGSVVGACHQFRGEMFHAEHIRHPILQPATILLFDTVIDMTAQMPLRSYVLPSETDQGNQSFLARFGLKESVFLPEESLKSIRHVLKAGLPPEMDRLPEALSADLVERIDATISDLAYIGNVNADKEIDHNLRYHQFWMTEGHKLAEQGVRQPHLREAFETWSNAGRAKFTLPRLKRWRKSAEMLGSTPPPAALRHYCGIDKKYRSLEEDVGRAAFEYDEQINMEIHDRHRS